jgi:hypothetical protein
MARAARVGTLTFASFPALLRVLAYALIACRRNGFLRLCKFSRS